MSNLRQKSIITAESSVLYYLKHALFLYCLIITTGQAVVQTVSEFLKVLGRFFLALVLNLTSVRLNEKPAFVENGLLLK